MAIIGKIQEKGRYLLVGFVGLALLTFIFSGLQKCGASGGGPLAIGTIGGDEVNVDNYQKAVARMEMQDRNQYAQQQREYTDRDQEQSADRAWAQTVDEQLLGQEYEALGIDISDNELNAYLFGEDGFQLLPDIAQNFRDSITGQFNPSALERFLDEREHAKDPQAITEWKDTKDALRKQRQQEKYFQLVSQTMYVTKLEAKAEYTAQKEVKSIDFVLRSFRDLKDEDIRITDAEIRKFYEAHKSEKKYEVMAGRDVKYFDIAIQPSHSDSVEFKKKLNLIKKEFAAKKTTAEDSVFVMMNSDLRFFQSSHLATFRPQSDPKARQGMTYPPYMDTVFKTASVGQIVGPYDDNGKTRIAKIIGFNTDVMSVRHILIAAQKGDTKKIASAKKLADSLVKLVNKDNFAEFVTKYSEDPGSKTTGGEYKDFMDYEMVEPFSNFAKEKPVGTIGVVQTDFGFHIIEVLDRKPVKYPVLALIEKTLTPSAETETALRDKAYNLLFQFDAQIAKKKDVLAKLNLFDTLAKREGYFARPVRLLDESPKVTGFNTKLAEQKILGLAYGDDPEVGRLCSAPINDKGRYIIAMISSIRPEKGEPAFEDSYLTMRAEAIKEKKANKYIAQIGGERNLAKLAKKGNTIVNSAEVTFANPSIQGGGYEPEVVGDIFSGLKDGQTTKPIAGNAGVYVIQLKKTTKAPAAADYEAERMQMLAQLKGSLQSNARMALQKRAVVMDNRSLQRLNIQR